MTKALPLMPRKTLPELVPKSTQILSYPDADTLSKRNKKYV